MEDKLAKATGLENNEAFDNTFPWLSSENPAMALEEPTCPDCDEQDLITRITDESNEGEELLPEVKENWWVDIDGINWEWMYPTSINNSDHARSPVHDVQVEEIPIIASYPLCTALYGNYVEPASPNDGANDNHEVFCNTVELSEGEELMPKAEDSLSEDIEGINWDWIDPNMNSDLDNDNSRVHDTQVEDDASHLTFDNCVAAAQDTFQELNSVSRGDIRSPSEITPIQEDDSWSTSPSLSEGKKLLTVRSISSSHGINKCPFLSTAGKILNNNAPPNSPARPDLLSMLKDLAAKLRDLSNDINALVGHLAVESPSDAWIESVFSTTRSVNGSLECKTSLSSIVSSASKEHEENVCSHGFWEDPEH